MPGKTFGHAWAMTPGIARYCGSMIFFYFGVSASQYHSILFESKGLAGSSLGLLLMFGSLAGVIAPLVFAPLGKRVSHQLRPILLAACVAGCTLSLFPYLDSPAVIFPFYFAHMICLWGLFPLHTAYGIQMTVRKGRPHFFWIRALGTLGFALGCACASLTFHFLGFRWLYAIFAIAYGFFFWSLWGTREALRSTPGTPEPPAAAPGKGDPHPLHDPLFLGLLGAIGILGCGNYMAISLQGNYILHVFGGTPSTVSAAWLFITSVEIPIMILCVFLVKRLGIVAVLAFGFMGTCLRLGGMAVAISYWELLLALSLHGFFFAGVVTGLGICINKIRPESPASLQSLSALVYAGIPNSFGAYLSGWIWENYSLRTVYHAALVISLVGTAVFGLLYGRLRRRFS